MGGNFVNDDGPVLLNWPGRYRGSEGFGSWLIGLL